MLPKVLRRLYPPRCALVVSSRRPFRDLRARMPGIGGAAASLLGLTATVAVCLGSLRSSGEIAQFNANNPAASGYALVFADDFISPVTIDIHDSSSPGFKWYVKHFFGRRVTAPDEISMANGVLTLRPKSDNAGALSTAAPDASGKGWVGQAFGGGGYFAARLKFDPAIVDLSRGHPAFWAMALEHLLTNDAQWPGQPPGYEHFIEDDFFEYEPAPHFGTNSYGGAMHDWYGIWNRTCGKGQCNIQTPGGRYVIATPLGTDFRQFHTFGQLWVPATPASRGFVRYYFDGRPTPDLVSWSYQSGPGTPPPSGNSLFSIIDRQHLVVFLGAGADQPMSVAWVRVWQLPARGERLIGITG